MTPISKIAGAIAIAASLGATAFSAAPVQAQGFGFHVNPPDSNFSFGFNIGRPGYYHGHNPHFPTNCISQRRIDDAIEDQGYRHVRITDYGRRTTEARGTRGSWLYELVADTCSGRIIDRDRVRHI